MITKENLPEVLRYFEFTENKNIWTKSYPSGASITVDFDAKKIDYAPYDGRFSMGEYPTKEKPATGFVIHRDTTINFNANENFVCLVCVHLLLQKGYEAKHIVFEPAFKVGHVNKPSYGDILVFDKEYNPLILIENKTYGTEFSKEWNLMQKDGGQLFSYLGPLVNEMGLCQNLVLFAADFDDKEVILKNHIITLKDNEKRIKELDNAKTFADAQGKYFDVWNQTYGKSFETKGLFETDIAAYTVGKLKYTTKDLKGLSHAEIRPIYHEFATILRNHAITDFEHSFYILIDLFLCKITDERNNPDDLQFYYKGIARDTPKEYCNRLLKLYQQGKQQLFNVNVVNKDEEDIRQIFEDTNRSVTNGLFAGIKELFEEMKFYNIKKFNFIDVENKEEFEMNFQILIKIAALIQDINLSSSETNHFFGDLFEGLLSKNVHQTEGQFFTPLPIVNFIIRSLPQFPNTDKVKVLDYACGAGHFLTEFVKHYPHAQAYGIEKSQTLSQVAKIATIINGSQDSRIVFKDSLSHINTMDVRFQGFDKDTFDCIIANPPYSVKGFLNTLEQKDREQYELSEFVEEKAYTTNRAIECFFVERAKYFLKKEGLMGIVLPSSLLSNENIYTKTRELLFANFNILAIAVMNSRTFGSTGTNTVILFAQKVKKNSKGLLNTFIEKNDYTQYTTSGAIDSYIQKQGYPKDEYFVFMQDNVLGDTLKDTEVFKDYLSNFKPSSISRSLQKEWFTKSSYYKDCIKENSKEYKSLLTKFLLSDEYESLQELERTRQFVAFAKEIESRKLNVYIQTESNIVAILQSPPEKIGNKSNKAEVVKFLGYDWSNRKGDEGIKYLTSRLMDTDSADSEDDKDEEIVQAINSIKYIETPLYNPDNDEDETRFSYALRKHITDQCNRFSFGVAKTYDIPFAYEEDGLLQYARLTDMIDFSRTAFNLAIRTNVEKKAEEVKYKVPIKEYRLSDTALFELSIGKRILNSELSNSFDIPVYSANVFEPFGFINKLLIEDFSRPSVIWGIDGDWMVNYIAANQKFYPTDHCGVLRCKTDEINPYFLSMLLETAGNRFGFRRELRASIERIKSLSVKIPSLTLQQRIVAECQQIDAESREAKDKIAKLQEEIAEIVADAKGEKIKLKDIAEIISTGPFGTMIHKHEYIPDGTYFLINPQDIVDNKITYAKISRISEKTAERLETYKLRENDIVIARRGDLSKCAIVTNDDRNCICGTGSFFIHLNNNKVDSRYFLYMYTGKDLQSLIANQSIGLTMPNLNQSILNGLGIPVPPLAEQKSIVEQIRKVEKEIASLKVICDTTDSRKKAILERELIDNGNVTNESDVADATDLQSSVSLKHPAVINSYDFQQREDKSGFIPLYTLRAACGRFEEEELPEEEGWVDASGNGFMPDPKRHFVVHAKGESMLPKIKDGDLCVFEWYQAGSREGEIVLAQCADFDSDYDGKYTIKRYHSEKVATEEGWEHGKVELIPQNSDYDIIELNADEDYRTIGIFKCVL